MFLSFGSQESAGEGPVTEGSQSGGGQDQREMSPQRGRLCRRLTVHQERKLQMCLFMCVCVSVYVYVCVFVCIVMFVCVGG